MIKDEILAKAKAILDEKEKRSICIKANICPECGELLKETNIDESGGITTYCPIDEKHYSRWEDLSDDEEFI